MTRFRPIAIAFAIAIAGCQMPSRIHDVQQPATSMLGPAIDQTVGQVTDATPVASIDEEEVAAGDQPLTVTVVQASATFVEQPIRTADVSEADAADPLLELIALQDEQTGPDFLDAAEEPADVPPVPADVPPVPTDGTTVADQQTVTPAVHSYPVNLPTVLRLVGSQNWAVQLATERIQEAEAKVAAAEAIWLPSLNIGLGTSKHDGQIQATNGDVVDVSRNAMFLGGGAKVGNAPLAGGAGGPSRMQVDLSIADALFQPLVARQLSCAAKHRRAVDLNNAETQATLAYFDLVAAQGEVAVIEENLADANALLDTTQAFVEAGKAAASEISRVEIVVLNQQQAMVDAKLKMKLASTELIRLVRLDPALIGNGTILYSADQGLLPVEFIPDGYDLNSLISVGQHSRPELAELGAIEQARLADAKGQEMRPYIPNLYTGISTGVFGGGQGSDIRGLDGRADMDVQLIWEVRNLGYGEMAARSERNSRYRQAVLRNHQMKEQIAAEVKASWYRSQAAREKMSMAETNVADAGKTLASNLDRIEGLEGLPIEAIQALTAVSDARLAYLQTVVDYNKAQTQLLRAVGRSVR